MGDSLNGAQLNVPNDEMCNSENNTDCENSPKNDKLAILILFFLYTLQGIPLGLADSTQLMLQSKHVTYKDQATFSISSYPFSMKLLWAPIVDSLYWRKFGRRKSWLIPAQTLLGASMAVLSLYISVLLGEDNEPPNVVILTVIFFALNFLTATQDIAVDGWALTMLSRKNVAYASVCSTTGQKIGYFMGYTIFLVLESPDFCNKYLRTVPSAYGLVTFTGFLRTSGLIFLISTLGILIFKSEEKIEKDNQKSFKKIKEVYIHLYRILRLKNVLLLIAVLLSFQVAWVATDFITKLKFIEAGVSKEKYTLLETPQTFVEMLLPFFISSFFVGATPLNVFLKVFPFKLMIGLLLTLLVWCTPFTKLDSENFAIYFYAMIVLGLVLNTAMTISLTLPLISFFNKVSDPSIGGTYMTLLNTCFNIGTSWTSTLALWAVDELTFRNCEDRASNCSSTASDLTQ